MRASPSFFSAAVISCLLAIGGAACSTAPHGTGDGGAKAPSQALESQLRNPEWNSRPANGDDWQKRAAFLEAKGFRVEARQVIQRAFSETANLACLSAWIGMDEKLFHQLDKKQTTLTRWVEHPVPRPPLKKPEFLDTVDFSNGVPKINPIIAATAVAVQQQKEHTALVISYELSHLVQVLEPDKVQATLETYDLLRGSQTSLSSHISQALQSSSESHQQPLVQLSARQKAFQREVIAARCNFSSFAVVSPSLAKAEQLIFISKKESPNALLPFGHSKERLREAAMAISRSVGSATGILLETHEEVRLQFFTVWKSMRETARKEELEELKVIQTLSDSLSTEKLSGANKWWPK